MDGAFGKVEVRSPLIEEIDQTTHQATLGLPLLTEEEHVVTGEEAVDDFGDDGVLVAQDPGEEVVTPLDGGDERAPALTRVRK